MALLDLTTTTDDARSGSSISALGTASTIAVKVRLNGACLLSPAAYARRIVWEIGSLAGARRCNLRLYHNPSPNPDVVQFDLLNNGGSSVSMTYDRTAIVSGDYYIIYTALGPGGWDLKLFASDGTQLASQTNADTSGPGASNSANGKLSVGQGVDSAATTDSMVGYVDGIAVYSAVLAGDARWSAPAAADANILSMVCFDEGTGTTAADAATGGSNLTLSGAGWQSGGTWASDTTAPTLSSPTGAANGNTAMTGSVSTNEGNGTLYWVVTTSSTSPSAAQVQAGNDHNGAAAPASGSQAVSATGTQNISDNGLTAGTTYYVHYSHKDAANNSSTTSTSASFTTTGGTTNTGIRTGSSFIRGVFNSIVSKYSG